MGIAGFHGHPARPWAKRRANAEACRGEDVHALFVYGARGRVAAVR
jgi:hypothetical protein